MAKTKTINSTAIFFIIIIIAGAALFTFQMNLLSPKIASMEKRYKQALEKINSGDYLGAELILQNLIKENPKDLDYKNSLGFVYAHTQRRKYAVDVFKEIIEMNKNYDKAYANLGAIFESYAIEYKENGKIDKAIDYYEMAKTQYQNALKAIKTNDKVYSEKLKNVIEELEELSSK